MDVSKGEQLFVSYKSENANLVRKLVDFLLSQAIPTWFVEYDLKLNDFSQLEKVIESAILSSKYALLFIDEAWSSSDFIAKEAKWIEKCCTNHGLNVLVVKLDKSKNHRHKYSSLFKHDFPELQYDGDFDSLIKFLSENTTFQFPSITFPTFRDDSERFKIYKGVDFSPGPFRFDHQKTAARRAEMREEKNPFIKFIIEPLFSKRLYHVLHCFNGEFLSKKIRLVILFYPYNATTFGFFPSLTHFDDDIKTYFYYRKYAEKWVTGKKWKDKGAHIFMHHGNRNLGFSYFIPTESTVDGVSGWERHYVIGLRDSKKNEKVKGEIKLVFFCEEVKDPRVFHSLCLHIENIASSLRIDSRKVYSKSFKNYLSIVVTLTIVGMVGLLFAGYASNNGLWATLKIALVFLVGGLLVFLFLFYLIGEVQIMISDTTDNKDDRTPLQRALTIFIFLLFIAFTIRFLVSLI